MADEPNNTFGVAFSQATGAYLGQLVAEANAPKHQQQSAVCAVEVDPAHKSESAAQEDGQPERVVLDLSKQSEDFREGFDIGQQYKEGVLQAQLKEILQQVDQVLDQERKEHSQALSLAASELSKANEQAASELSRAKEQAQRDEALLEMNLAHQTEDMVKKLQAKTSRPGDQRIPCVDRREAMLQCYNSDQASLDPLVCSSFVQAYRQCVQSASTTAFKW